MDKPDGSLRPLAVPELRDRIRERALLTVMEILAAPRQSSQSIGFRYNQDVSRGLSWMLGRAIKQYGVDGFNLLDTDFRKYYDSIPHSGLKTVLRRLGLRGSNIMYLRSSLIAPVMSSRMMVDKARGKVEGPMAKAVYVPRKGTPQGCVISPLLANLYGTGLDRRLGLKQLPFIRYADNLLVAYPNDWNREKVLGILEEAKPAGITLHEGKTQTLEGEGTLLTLGCAIRRYIGKLELLICGGYLGKPKAKDRKNLEPYGGIPYMGRILDFLRNLRIHSLHQYYADRRAWARHVGNRETYRWNASGESIRGGLWRKIDLHPELTGTMKIKGTPLFNVRSWKLGKGITATNLMEEVRKGREAILEMKLRLHEILDQSISTIPGRALRLKAEYTKDGFTLNPQCYRAKPKYNSKETRFSKELKAKVLLAQDKAEYNWSEVRRIGIGLRAMGRRPGARLPGWLKLID